MSCQSCGTHSALMSNAVAVAIGIHGVAAACVSGAPALPTTRRGPVSVSSTTVHHPTRSTRGASSTSTCSFSACPAAATCWMSSSSRWASSRPVCGRMASTRTP